MKHRVVISGMGVVSPVGNDVVCFWESLRNGKCGIKELPDNLMVKDADVHFAGLVTDFALEKNLDLREARKLAKFSQFAVYASKDAFKDADIDITKEDASKVGVIIGSGLGAIDIYEQESISLYKFGARGVSPLLIPMSIVNMAAGNVAIYTGAKGICSTVTTACATGTHCVGDAFRVLQEGRAQVILAGGTEASISPLTIAGFNAISALSNSKDKCRASIPFDKERNGFILGEGAGVVVMETLEHAQKRGAQILAEIVGYGATGDAYHITSPALDGEGAARAMQEALLEAEINNSDVDYINAHGTSTLHNDLIETIAIKKVFGDDTKVAISSTKSMTGHLLGAAGGIETIAIVKAVMDDYAPPTIGYIFKDENCDLDYIPNIGRAMTIRYAMSNSFGFGGHNACIIVKKWEGI